MVWPGANALIWLILTVSLELLHSLIVTDQRVDAEQTNNQQTGLPRAAGKREKVI